MNESTPHTIPTAQLEELSGLGARRLYQLSEAGRIPKPNADQWPTGKTLRQLFDYFRTRKEPDQLSAARLEKISRETELLSIKIGQRRGDLVEVNRVIATMESLVSRVRAQMDSAFRNELPAKQGGLPSDQIASMNGQRLDEIYEQLSKPLV
jgi:hypothetical protein